VHTLYAENAKRSPFFDIVVTFFYFLEEKTGIVVDGIERIKFNMLSESGATRDDTYNTPHIDVPQSQLQEPRLLRDRQRRRHRSSSTKPSTARRSLTVRKRVSPSEGQGRRLRFQHLAREQQPKRTHSNQNRAQLLLQREVAKGPHHRRKPRTRPGLPHERERLRRSSGHL
jgi:hypothetical protein